MVNLPPLRTSLASYHASLITVLTVKSVEIVDDDYLPPYLPQHSFFLKFLRSRYGLFSSKPSSVPSFSVAEVCDPDFVPGLYGIDKDEIQVRIGNTWNLFVEFAIEDEDYTPFLSEDRAYFRLV